MQAGSGMLRENSGTRSDMKSGSGNDPRSCQNVDVWGEKVAFVSPNCPYRDLGMTVPKWRCYECWEAQIRKTDRDARRKTAGKGKDEHGDLQQDRGGNRLG